MAPRRKKAEDTESSGEDMALTAIGAVANAAQKSGLVKSLLGPSAKVLGDYWGKRTQEYVEGLEERRAKNISVHYEKVKTIEHVEPPKNGPTERQFTALVEWTEHAQSVDPEAEPELSALWQSLLSRIYKNDPYADELQSVLTNMSRADAKVFLSLNPKFRHRLDPPYLERFKQWGLIDSQLSYSSLYYIATLGLSAVIMALVGQQAPNLFPAPDPDYWSQKLPAYSIMLAGFIVAMIVLFLLKDLGQVRLTPLGRRLHDSGMKYFKAGKA